MIDKKSRLPLYAQLIDLLIQRINNGELKEHEQLPSERELCEKYNISRTTVRQAMIELENEGYIYKVHGKGSFVSAQSFTQSLVKMYSFTEEMKKLGKQPRSETLSFSIVPSSAYLTKKLKLQEGEMIYQFFRIRFADDEPIMYERTYVPAKHFPDLTKSDLEANSLYDLIQFKYGFPITNANESFKAVSMKEVEANHLCDKEGAPAMEIKRLTFSGPLAVEYTISIARGDKYVYTIDLK